MPNISIPLPQFVAAYIIKTKSIISNKSNRYVSFQISAFALHLNCIILPPPLPSERHFVPLISPIHNNFIYFLSKYIRLIFPCFSITNYQLLLINIYSLYSIFYDIFIIFSITHNFSQHISYILIIQGR